MSTDNERTADKRFAANLFSGAADHADDDGDQGASEQGASEYTDGEREWARELFAAADDDDVLPGLKSGRHVARTTPPRAPEVPRDEFRFS